MLCAGASNTGSGWSIETSSDVHGGTKRFKTNVGYTTRVGGSRVAGGTVSGTVTCGQVYDEIYAAFDSTCP